MAEYSIFNVLPKWYYYATLFMYLIYWPMAIMISLVGSYDSDYARVYQIRPNTSLTVTNMQDCYDYIQMQILSDSDNVLQMFMGGNGCQARTDSPCTLKDFSSGPATVVSGPGQEGLVQFSLECNTNYKQTIQFYTTAISVVCMLLAFVLIANCLIITLIHNLIVCVCKYNGNSGRSSRIVPPPNYSKKHEYQPIQ